MRKLRVVFTTVGGLVPALLATFVAPAMDACGGEVEEPSGQRDGGDERSPFAERDSSFTPYDAGPYTPPSYIVEIPEAGTPADPGQLCAVPSPVVSNVAARVTLSDYSSNGETAKGFIAVAPAVEPTLVGLPKLTVKSPTYPELEEMVVTNLTKVAGGFQFDAQWPKGVPYWGNVQMTIETSFTITCADGGTTTVSALTKLDLCCDDKVGYEWVSSGDACTICEVIAEMAPSPIVSDKTGDDLPLGMVLRLRVVEVARAGRQVLLFADNDAGAGSQYEWRVSEGLLERVSDDVMLWTLPEEMGPAPFGQVAVWNDAGAAVENFVFAVAWQEAA
ncbi:MAG: hypothetical protein K0S65_229 [Labilithrix sp.]|nr:hypothetical protein [Labilithrix sp.]